MSALFEELSSTLTPMGPLTLRRRLEPTRRVDVYEVKLGDEYLMSSQFTAGEVALARLALAELDRDGLDVAVGGLGLGYTAAAVLEAPRVRSCTIIEALGDVIAWHRDGLLPEVADIAADPRTRFVHADFFARCAAGGGLDPDGPGQRFDAVLVDIDHTPSHTLAPGHAGFYTPEGLGGLADQLTVGGVFALWSDDPPDATFLATLGEVFDEPRAQIVAFPNHLAGGEAANTVYLARRR